MGEIIAPQQLADQLKFEDFYGALGTPIA